ncbi:SLIT3 [Branchiostoma lanceolatum]|uniref:SLIT3 protein n=1 Tax=Branchiostoma lanceolatum TaxID=7740 RepID=A0A8J9ZP36_BRALA|nr:SLIT3 [Branchiostoma lanceolatum]
MKAGKLFLFVALGSLWSGCTHCLPDGCKIRKPELHVPATTVECKFLGLTQIPRDIPPNADRVVLTYNAIRTVTSLPPLPQLYTLDLSENSIESVVWESLCNLPALEVLYLHNNRLQYVKLDTVIEYLPKLKNVFLAYNKLVSCTLHELGWPQMTVVSMRGNPAPCDCSSSVYGLTERTCLERGVDARCSSCSACFFLSGRKREDLYCKRPDEANQLLLPNVSTHLAECGRKQSTARAATTEISMMTTEESQRQTHSSEMDTSSTKDEVKSLHPTARAKTTATASIVMGTEKAKTNNLQTSEAGTLPTDGTYHSTAATLSTIKTSDKTYSLATIQANPTQTDISKSSTTSKELKTPEDKELPIGYITIAVFGSALTLMFVTCFSRLLLMRYRMRGDRRQEANRGHPIPLHQISSQMANPIHNITSAGGGNHGQLVNSTHNSTTEGGGDQEHLANSTHSSTTAGGGDQEHLANSTHNSTTAGGGDQEHLANSTYGSTSVGGGDQEHLANSTYGSTSAGGGDQEHLANSTYGSTSAGGGDQEHLANSTYGSTSAGGGDQEHLANSTHNSTTAGGGDQEHLANSTYGSTSAGGGDQEHLANSTYGSTSVGGGDQEHLANSTYGSTSVGGGDQEHLANSTYGSTSAGGGDQEHLANSTYGSTSAGGGDQEHLANSTYGSTSVGGGDQEHLANSTYGSTSAGGGDQEHLANSTYGTTSIGRGDQEHLANSTYGTTSIGRGDQEHLANSTYGSTNAGGGDQEHLANSLHTAQLL